jgi:thiamine-monophosphate kinase
MAAETRFIDALRGLATHPGARGLIDDAAVLDIGGTRLVLTHDMLVESVHFLASDPPESVAWKLLAVNLSDLAAKGAKPLGALMAYALTGDPDWDDRFVQGLGTALSHFGVALLGGDTVSASQRSLGLTLVGEATGNVPARSGAASGDALFVTGTIGDAGPGLQMARGELPEDPALLRAFQYPVPQLSAGYALCGSVTAMMDVSDGLLIDAARLANASGCAVMLDLDAVPLSEAFHRAKGADRAARLFAATAGDDYQLLFTSSLPLPPVDCSVTRIGQCPLARATWLASRLALSVKAAL